MSSLTSGAETCADFWKIFNNEVSLLHDDLQSVSNGAGADESKAKLTKWRQQTLQLQTFATESTKVLPAYDIRRSQEILEDINSRIKTIEQQIQPKKKFAFSSKAKPTTTTTIAKTVPVIQNEDPVGLSEKEKRDASDEKQAAVLPVGSFVIRGESSRCFSYSQNDVRSQLQINEDNEDIQIGLYLQNIEKCSITLPWVLGSVRVENVSHSEIYLGPVSTSVYLEHVTDCVLHFACHQLRIHNCSTCRLYIHVRSHPIIEDCHALGFAPYLLNYPTLSQQLQQADLSTVESQWDHVVDFRWHKSTPSPNWFIIPSDQRIAPPAITLEGTDEDNNSMLHETMNKNVENNALNGQTVEEF
eukprot:gene2935-3202_t